MFNKLNHLEQIDKFLEKHNKTRLTYKEIENLNRPIMSKIKSSGLDDFTSEFYQTFKEALKPILLKVL